MKEIEKIQSDLFKELQQLDLGFHPDLRGKVETSFVELGIINSKRPEILWSCEWCSEITIHTSSTIFGAREADINFGSSGSFIPKDKAQFWRTKHAWIVLDNWNIIIPIIEKYCTKVKELEKLIP